MPAVDSPDDDGLLPGGLGELLRTLVRSERCVGLNLTIYDPDLDPDGTCAAPLAELLVQALAQP
jgi:arginase